MDQVIEPVAIFLSGAMLDYTGDHRSKEAQGWREELAKNAPTGVLFVSPAHAVFGASQVTAPVLDRVCRYMIQSCDGLLVNMLPEHPVFGSIRDIEFSRVHLGQPVAVAGDVKSLMAHDVIVRDTIEDAFTALLEEIAVRRQQQFLPQFGIIQIGGNDGSDD